MTDGERREQDAPWSIDRGGVCVGGEAPPARRSDHTDEMTTIAAFTPARARAKDEPKPSRNR